MRYHSQSVLPHGRLLACRGTRFMARPGGSEVVLVTGFPALQARKLLVHLLAAEPETFVYAVVLKTLWPQAVEVLGALGPEQRSRVELLEGDAAALDMGLSGREYRAIGREIDRIHHVAHVSYAGVDRETAKLTNVRGAVEAIELAKASPSLRCLVHHSTAAISGDREGMFYEDELDEGQHFVTVVEQTRMQAEKAMRRAMRELPIVVVRPTTIVGDSGTGEADHFDGPYLLVTLILALPSEIAVPLPHPGTTPVNIVPVDFVVRAAHAIGRHPDAPGKTAHLASHEGLTAARLFELVARAGGRRTARSHFSTRVAQALLAVPGVGRLLHKPRELVQQLATAADYDTRSADQLLGGTGIECPPFSSYVDTLVSAVQDRLSHKRRELLAAVEALRAEDPFA